MLIVILSSIFLFIILLRLYLKSCIKKCECKTSMVGKVVIVTGANSGIGYHTAHKLAAKGAKIILGCRNINRGNTAAEKIKHETGNSQVIFKQLDLASLNSVREFASDVMKITQRLDVLVNNAGACALQNQYTTDGILEGMQVNHFGPFLLTSLLLPLLKKSQPSRIINVSSLIYMFGCVNTKKINDMRLNKTILYADSKLCNLVIQQEFARRLAEIDVAINAVHPGVIYTNILGERNLFFELFLKFMCWISSRTAEDGAQTVVHVALAEDCAKDSGKFYIDCKDRYILPKARDLALAKKLWALSEDVVKDYL